MLGCGKSTKVVVGSFRQGRCWFAKIVSLQALRSAKIWLFVDAKYGIQLYFPSSTVVCQGKDIGSHSPNCSAKDMSRRDET